MDIKKNFQVATIRTALQENPNVTVSFLIDALRGTRESPEPSCASLLVPLVADFGPDRVEIRMYHTPNLTGLRKRLIPKRINEGWGLQHMKLYGFDDEIIMSGCELLIFFFSSIPLSTTITSLSSSFPSKPSITGRKSASALFPNQHSF